MFVVTTIPLNMQRWVWEQQLITDTHTHMTDTQVLTLQGYVQQKAGECEGVREGCRKTEQEQIINDAKKEF